MSTTIVEFLLARIAEDEAVAKASTPAPWRTAWTPAHVLAECEAKRRIVDEHRSYETEVLTPDDEENVVLCRCCGDDFPCNTLRHLAAVYADHPDYDEAWRG